MLVIDVGGAEPFETSNLGLKPGLLHQAWVAGRDRLGHRELVRLTLAGAKRGSRPARAEWRYRAISRPISTGRRSPIGETRGTECRLVGGCFSRGLRNRIEPAGATLGACEIRASPRASRRTIGSLADIFLDRRCHIFSSTARSNNLSRGSSESGLMSLGRDMAKRSTGWHREFFDPRCPTAEGLSPGATWRATSPALEVKPCNGWKN